MSNENPYAQYHVVKKGDTLSKIAEEDPFESASATQVSSGAPGGA